MRPTPDQIIDAVSVVSGVPFSIFFGAKTRTSTHVEAVATAAVLMRELRNMSYGEIAKYLKRRHHTSVLKIEFRANEDWIRLAKRDLDGDTRTLPDPSIKSAWQRLEAMLGRKGALLAMERVLLKALKEGVPA